MRKKLLTLLGSVCLIFVLAAMPFVVACSAPTEEVTPTLPAEEEPTPASPTEPTVKPVEVIIPPPGVMPVVFLSGSEHQMGYQYGRQAGAYIQIVSDGLWASLLARYDEATILDHLAEYEGYVKQLSEVDLVTMMEGMASGARAAGFDVSYEDILAINYQVELEWFPLLACTNMAVWGDATADGETIVGSNFDFPWANGYAYRVILVAYPSNGNAFVSIAIAGMLGNNLLMNDKGLVYMSNKSANKRAEDVDYGVPDFILGVYVAMTCSNAEEARDTILSVPSTNGINRLVVDANGEAYVVEGTAALASVREPGDFGEEGYLIATNHFLNPDLKPTQVPWEAEEYYPSSSYRYETVEKYIEDNYGSVDTSTVMGIMSSTDYWDGEEWQYDAGWTGNTVNRFGGATLASKVAIPAERTVYICTGNPTTAYWGTGAPGQTGQYIKLQLGDSSCSTANSMKGAAMSEVTSLAQVLTSPDIEEQLPISAILAIDEEFDLVMEQYWIGVRYYVEACLAESQNEALELYGKASTEFGKVQAGAKRLKDLLGIF